MRLTAFETYALLMALKQHFTQANYDYFKYHGKTRANKESFIQRKDRFYYQKLSRKYDSEQMVDFLVANLLKELTWVGNLLDDEAHDNYMAYLKRKQALAYTFADDLDNFFSNAPPELAFKVGSGLPPILNTIMCGTMSPETFVILDRFIGFSESLNKTLEDDYLWSKYKALPRKLHPFLSYDKDKMKSILKEKIHEYGLSNKEQKAG